MVAYIGRRLILAFFTVWVISLLTFLIIQLPEGDAIDRYLELLEIEGGGLGRVDGERVARQLREYLGYDKPMFVRYGMWVWKLLHGDLGRSYQYFGASYLPPETPVKEIVGDRIWTTVALTGFTILVTWTFAIPVGIYSAVRQHSVGD